MTYFSQEQVSQLLRAINTKRVSKDGKGFSHVEAYDVRAHCNRLFGFGRWSIDVTHESLVFESSEMRRKKNKQGEEYGDPYTAWTVCYKARVLLTVNAPDGTVLAHYEDGATGEAANQPGRGDAHDLAMKTAISQAFKRAAVNLGDQMGASLYSKGSTAALVRKTLVMPDAEPSEDAVDAHITEQLPREDEAAEPQEDPRTTSQTPAAPPRAAAGPVEGGVTPVAPPSTPPDDTQRLALIASEIRDMALGEPEPGYSIHRWLAHVQGTAVKRGGAAVLKVPVESSLSPTQVSLNVFLEECLKGAMDRERESRAS